VPKKKPVAENETVNAPAPKEQGGAKSESAPKPRTRIAQPKKEKTTDTPPKTPVVQDAPKKPTRKRSSPTKKSAPQEQATQEAPVTEERIPITEAQLPAPAESALPVQVQEPQGIQVAVPPVPFPTLGVQRRRFWSRLLFLLAISALLALSALILAYRPTAYSAYSHSIVFLHRAEDNTTQVLYDGENCAEGLAGACVRSERDRSGSVCAALIGDTLYLVRGDEVQKVCAAVTDFALSQNGRTLAYRTVDQKLFCAKTGRVLEISAVSQDTRDARYCLSPDGELLFYTYVVQNDTGESKTHADVFSRSGKKPLLPQTTDVIPVAIADDYEHIFYFNVAGDLYYMNAESEVSLCRRKGESEMELLFDREFEELLIKDADGMTLWQEGAPTVLSGLKGAEYLSLLPNQLAVCRELPCAKQYLVRSLNESYYLKLGTQEQGREMVYLNGNELHTVAFIDAGGSTPVVTDKGVYYMERVTLKDEERKQLYCCAIGETVPRSLAFDVDSFQVNSDGSRLLYADHRKALYAARVVGDALDPTRISDLVDPASLCVSACDAFYYRSADGTWFVSDNAGEPDAVSVQGRAYTDVHTAFFFVAESATSDGEALSATYTVYTNHRNRRQCEKVATGVDIPFLHP